MNYVLCFLVLFVVSVHSRVAIEEHDDVINNIVQDDLLKPVLSIIDKIKTTSHKLINENVISEDTHETTTDNVVLEVAKIQNTSSTLKNETYDEPVRVDNGTALILTKYLKEGKAKEARIAAKVDPSLFLGIKSYSGYFTVNETYNSNLFFWYFPVPDKPVNETPWIIWLQGGPGASSLAGLFDEIGPFSVVNNKLIANPYTWLQNHSLVFIENPVGTGFSFTEDEKGYATDMATYSKHLFTTLKQFLEVFPELRTAPLFVAGESYAGKYVPALGMEIHKRWGQSKDKINFQGMMIGNAYVDPEMISHIIWPFYYFGLLDRAQIDIVKPLYDAFKEDIKNNNSVEAKQKWNILVSVLLMLTHQQQAYNYLKDDMVLGSYTNLLSTSEVKRALHVGDIKYNFLNITVNTKIAPDFLSTTKPFFEKLLEHYRVLAYCGHLDQMLPCAFTSENYRTWKWNSSNDFLKAMRDPYYFNRKLAGYYKSGGNLTEVVIRNAGHMVPMDAPAPVQNMITRWTHAQPLGSGNIRNYVFNTIVAELVKNNSAVINMNYL